MLAPQIWRNISVLFADVNIFLIPTTFWCTETIGTCCSLKQRRYASHSCSWTPRVVCIWKLNFLGHCYIPWCYLHFLMFSICRTTVHSQLVMTFLKIHNVKIPVHCEKWLPLCDGLKPKPFEPPMSPVQL